MRAAIAELLGSKKFLTMIAGLLVTAGAKWGLKLDPEVCIAILSLFGILIGAQGAASVGKEAAQIRAAVPPLVGSELRITETSQAPANPTPPALTPPTPPTPTTGPGGFVRCTLLIVIAIAAWPIAMLASCSSMKSGATSAASSFVDCTKEGVRESVTELRPVGMSLIANSVTNGKVDYGQVRDLAKGFATDVARCMVADAIARLVAPPAAGAPKVAPFDVDPVVARGFVKELYGGIKFKTEAGDL